MGLVFEDSARGILTCKNRRDPGYQLLDATMKHLLEHEIQATSLHSLRVQLIKLLRLPNSELIFPAANLTLAEKLVELLHILQAAERCLLHLLKPNLFDHTLKPLLRHLHFQELRDPFDLPSGIPLQILERQEQDVALPILLPARAPPTQSMLEPISPLHLPPTKHVQPQLPIRLEESAPTLPALKPIVANAHIFWVSRYIDIPARLRGWISAQRHRVRHMRLEDPRMRRHVQVLSGSGVCPGALYPVQGVAQRVTAAMAVEIGAG